MTIENSYKVTKRKYMGWARESLKKRGKKLLILWGVAALLAAGVTVYSLVKKDLVHGSLYAVIAAFCVYRGFLRMDMLLAKQYKVLQSIQGAKEWKRTITFEGKSDKITVVDGNQTAQYKYKNAVKLKEIGNYYWLYFNDGISISLEKDGFKEGTREEFIQFMKSSHPSIALELNS